MLLAVVKIQQLTTKSYAAAKSLDSIHKQNIQLGRQLGITSPSNGVPRAYTSDYGFCKLFHPVIIIIHVY